jgi:protein scribble
MKRPLPVTEVIDIRFERADKGLGLSIAGGLGSTPYKDNDEGIFISRVTVGGPAHVAGLRKDDKVMMAGSAFILRETR